jgi:hypothetical protein
MDNCGASVVMNTHVLNYILAFALGGGATYLLPKLIGQSEPEENLAVQMVSIPKESIDNAELAIERLDTRQADEATELETCQAKAQGLEQKVAAFAKEEGQDDYAYDDDTYKERIAEPYKNFIVKQSREIATLKSRLQEFEPKETTQQFEKLEELIPADFKLSVARLSDTQKDNILAFHQEQDVSNWAYIHETQIKDYILSHPMSEWVELTSITCKQDRCEIVLDEKINRESLVAQGLSREEINKIIETEPPKYRQLVDDLRSDPGLNLRRVGVGLRNRFSTYFFVGERNRES